MLLSFQRSAKKKQTSTKQSLSNITLYFDGHRPISIANIQACKIAVSVVVINPVFIKLWYVWQNELPFFWVFSTYRFDIGKFQLFGNFFYCKFLSWNLQLWNLRAILSPCDIFELSSCMVSFAMPSQLTF